METETFTAEDRLAAIQWPFNFHSNAYSASIVKPGSCKVFGFGVFNSNASTQYILVFDRAVVPGSGSTDGLVIPLPVATLSTLLVSYGDTGRTFERGIVLANSSTANSLTPGSADCWFDIQWL